ncbi:MAG: NAD(P)/FAD-dependent oxidoreductase [Candidatus Eisenbacteria bacterium]
MVGTGPAGVAAAVAAKAAGLSVAVFEGAGQPGGQLHRIYSKVMGVAPFEGDGAAFAQDLARRLADAGLAPRYGTPAEGLFGADERGPRLRLAGGEFISARAILIASGLRAQALGVQGEREFAGRGVSPSGRRDREIFAGQPVVVVGGGDAAFENALLLAEVGCRVTLIARGEPRARNEFRRRVAEQPAIELIPGTRVLEVLGDTRVTAVRVAGPRGESLLETRGVFVKIGSVPNSRWCGDGVTCDPEGYVRVDARGATSSPGIWAAGDVARPAAFTVPAAWAGAAAAIQAVRAEVC